MIKANHQVTAIGTAIILIGVIASCGQESPESREISSSQYNSTPTPTPEPGSGENEVADLDGPPAGENRNSPHKANLTGEEFIADFTGSTTVSTKAEAVAYCQKEDGTGDDDLIGMLVIMREVSSELSGAYVCKGSMDQAGTSQIITSTHALQGDTEESEKRIAVYAGFYTYGKEAKWIAVSISNTGIATQCNDGMMDSNVYQTGYLKNYYEQEENVSLCDNFSFPAGYTAAKGWSNIDVTVGGNSQTLSLVKISQ